jgi:ribonucleoside-diphosphate reductase alpha chain
VNLFFPSGSSRSYVNEVHVQAWRGKLKGLYYLRSTAEKTAEKVSHQVGKIKSQSEGCLSCHA